MPTALIGPIILLATKAPYGHDEDGIEVCRGPYPLGACRCGVCDLKYQIWRAEMMENYELEARRLEYSTWVINELNRRKSR